MAITGVLRYITVIKVAPTLISKLAQLWAKLVARWPWMATVTMKDQQERISSVQKIIGSDPSLLKLVPIWPRWGPGQFQVGKIWFGVGPSWFQFGTRLV